MKLQSIDTFVVGNPQPRRGGTYFVFVKMTTACGITGVGEIYNATFSPHLVAQMAEDVFARIFEGADPHHIETLWRRTYGTGYTLRPDVTVMGVLSALEMACWDIVGKAAGKPVYELLGGRVHERLRSYTYLYPPDAEDVYPDPDVPNVYNDPDIAAEIALHWVDEGFTAVKFDPAGPLHGVRRAPTAARGSRALRTLLQTHSRSRRHPRPVYGVRRKAHGAAARALRAALVRRAGTAGNAGTNG